MRRWLEVGGPVRELAKRSRILRRLARVTRLRARGPRFVSFGAGPAGTGGPRVLMATSAGGFLEGTTFDGVVAAALQERGADVHALLCDRSLPACQECSFGRVGGAERMARRGPRDGACPGCFEAGARAYGDLGVPVHRYSDVLSAQDRTDAAAFAAGASLADARHLEFDGAPAGEHAVAGALRFFGRADFEGEPQADVVVRRFLEGAALTVRVAEHIIDRIEVDVVVVHHGIYVPQGLIADVARRRGVRVVTWNPAYRSQSFIFSHDTTYHHTLLDEPVEAWESMQWNDSSREQLVDYLRSRWTGARDWVHFTDRPQVDVGEIERETGVDFGRPCIGLLTNVMWDAQLLYRANAYPDMVAWCVDTIRWFARRPDLQLLIRVHPAEIKGYIPSRQPILPALQDVLGSLPSNVFVIPPESRLSTYAAMLQCDAALVYATKTGVELSAMGLPVIVAGDAWVRNKGITLDASSPEEYRRLLDRLPLGRRLDDATLERAQKYAFHFFFRRMIPVELVEPTGYGEPKFRPAAVAREALVPARSAGLDVICDGILTGSPFIYPAELLPPVPLAPTTSAATP